MISIDTITLCILGCTLPCRVLYKVDHVCQLSLTKLNDVGCKNIGFHMRIGKEFGSEEICFCFFSVNSMEFIKKVKVVSVWDLGVVRFKVKLIEK